MGLWCRVHRDDGTSGMDSLGRGLALLSVGLDRHGRRNRLLGGLENSSRATGAGNALGLIGERFVGHFLQNKLLRRGYWIVHDICGDDFNVDHAIIGPGGAFAIETKMRRKPKGDVRIDYDGQQVLVAGHKPDRDPVAQAQAASKWLSRVLLEKTGISLPVQPVVLFPGWYVNLPLGNVETGVLNENLFIDRLDSQPVRLTHEQIFQLASGLGRHVLEQDERGK